MLYAYYKNDGISRNQLWAITDLSTSFDWYNFGHPHFRMFLGKRIQQNLQNRTRVTSQPKWSYYKNRNLSWIDYYKALHNPPASEKIVEIYNNGGNGGDSQICAY